MTRVLYKPWAIAVGVLGGLLARAALKQAWALLGDDGRVPRPTDRRRTWAQTAAAAAVEGAVSRSVKALVERGGAKAFEQLTGTWPE